MKLREKLTRVPSDAGTYLMKNDKSKVIYVGKAKNLKKRLSSYFLKSNHEDVKTKALVSEISDFEIFIVKNEVEALLLERTLIREHKPKFNVILRDDKDYPYIKIDFNSTWPRINKVRKRKDDGESYLGPFSHINQLNTILDLTFRIFPIIRCTPREFSSRKRPCNYYYMKRCLAPCVLNVSEDLYKDTVADALSFLTGKNKKLIKELNVKMRAASRQENYELAASYLEQLNALKTITQEQNVITKSTKDCDVFDYIIDQNTLSIHNIQIRDRAIKGQENFIIKTPIDDIENSISQIFLQFYDSRFIPEEIIFPKKIVDHKHLEEIFSKQKGKNVKITNPSRGQKIKLCQIAKKNAAYYLNESYDKQSKARLKLENLKNLLNLSQYPARIDCIDISNIQGTAIVASQVSFVDGKPEKKLYRLFNLGDLHDTPDDYASIRNVCERYFKRFKDSDSVPQMLVIDGGKGQLSAAKNIHKKFKNINLEIVSLAKDRTKYNTDNNSTKSHERVFQTGKKEPLILKEGSEEYKLLTQLRDEAHRFAITHHRKRRKKVLHGSKLDEIPKIGPKTRNKILRFIDDINKFKSMSLAEIEDIPDLRKDQAKAIFEYFN